MNRSMRLWAMALSISGSLFCGVAQGGEFTANVGQLEPPAVNASCLWFTLVGVPQADPINPNSPYFAIPPSQYGYDEIYALLLAAKLSGTPVTVVTTGGTAGAGCSTYAQIAAVWVN